MPFSVLRIWGLALFSWALLGCGVYFAYQAYEHFDRPARRVVLDEAPSSEINGEENAARTNPRRVVQRTETNRAGWEGWAYVAGSLLCFGWTIGGAWPAKYILGNSRGNELQSVLPISTLSLDRPDGSKLHVEIYGQNEGPTLIHTHGWSLDSSAWSYMKADLAKSFRVVVWDLAGLGQSTSSDNGDQSIEKMARDLEAVMQATSANKPVILVGHSIGGMIQQTFCRLFENHLGKSVRGIAFVHTTYVDPSKTNFAAAVTTALKPLIIPLNYLMIGLAPFAWVSNWQSYYNGSMHMMSRFTSFSGKQTRKQLDHSARLGARAWPSVIARGNLAMLKFDEEKTLRQISIPVLVISGKHDRMTLPSASEHMEKILPDDRPYQVDGGHLGYWEQAKDVAAVLQNFAHGTFAATATKAPSKVSLENRVL